MTTEQELKKQIEEPEGFDMGDSFQMEIYNYGVQEGIQSQKAKEDEFIDTILGQIDAFIMVKTPMCNLTINEQRKGIREIIIEEAKEVLEK